jgi:hypothetical protein
MLGAASGVIGVILLDSMATWAPPAGALIGLLGGAVLGQESARRKRMAERDPVCVREIQGVLRGGRAVVVVVAGSRAADAARLLRPSISVMGAGG